MFYEKFTDEGGNPVDNPLVSSEFSVVMSVRISHKNYVQFVFTSSCL